MNIGKSIKIKRVKLCLTTFNFNMMSCNNGTMVRAIHNSCVRFFGNNAAFLISQESVDP